MAYYYGRDSNAYAENGNTSSAVSYTRRQPPGPHRLRVHRRERLHGTCRTRSSSPPGTAASPTHLRPAESARTPRTGRTCLHPGLLRRRERAARSPRRRSGPRSGWRRSPPSSGTAPHTRQSTPGRWRRACPATGDGTSPTLWLDSITHTGADTTAGGQRGHLAEGELHPVDRARQPGQPGQLSRRSTGTGSTQITTETGSQISVSYELTNPCKPGSYPAPSSNTSSCFPVYWQQFTPSHRRGLVQQVRRRLGHRVRPDRRLTRRLHRRTPTAARPGITTTTRSSSRSTVPTGSGAATRRQHLHRHRHRPADQGEDRLLPGHGRRHATVGTRSVTLTDSQGGQHADSNQLAGDVLETTVLRLHGRPG